LEFEEYRVTDVEAAVQTPLVSLALHALLGTKQVLPEQRMH
jgi:hypothetical protein